MRTARLLTVCALVATTRCQHQGGEVLRWTSLNRTPVMTTRCHKQGSRRCPMSDVQGEQGWGSQVWCPRENCGWGWEDPMSNIQGGRVGEGALCSEIKCIMGNGHMGTPPTTLSFWTDRQTGTTENITFPQPHWRVVIIVSGVTVAMFNPTTIFVQSKCLMVVIRTLHEHIAVETGESLHALAAVELVPVQDTGPSVRTRARGARSCKHSHNSYKVLLKLQFGVKTYYLARFLLKTA